jgi:serine/threonine-protein kinase RsbW
MRQAASSPGSGEGWTLRRRGRDAGSTRRWSGSYDDSTHAADVRLTLPATPENIRVVRHVLGTLAHAFGMSPEVCEDLRLAVTEACTNVVRHAYGGTAGRMEIIARPSAEALEVIVADRGSGLGTSKDTLGPGYGLGLIETLADRFEIDHASGEGSRLQMWFAHHRPISETA